MMDTKTAETVTQVVGTLQQASKPVTMGDWQAILAAAVVTQPPAVKAKVTKVVKATAKALNLPVASAPAPAPVVAPVAPKAPAMGPVEPDTITLPLQLAAKVMAPITGQGGWQSLQAVLQAGCKFGSDGVYTLTMAPATISKLATYGTKFGGGGYQGTIRWILTCYVDQVVVKVLGL
jgi:hypothetical protein